MKASRSLQIKITFLVGLVVTAACLILTFGSIFSAFHYYNPLIMQDDIVEPALPDNIEDSGNTSVIDPQPEVKNKTETFSPDGLQESMPLVIKMTEVNRQYSMQNILLMLAILFLSVFSTYWLTGKALKPLKQLNQSISTIDSQTLDKRLPPASIEDEVGQLTNSFNRMLDRLDESFTMQKRFAANAAHELKTPLSVIRTSLEVLQLDPQPTLADYEEFAADTGIAADRLISTVDSLLALTKEGTACFDENVALKTVTTQAIQDLSANAAARNIQVRLSGTNAMVRGNGALLYRLVYNLLDNAIKYNKENGAIYVTTGQKPDNTVYITVKDTGIGMAPQDIKNIFEPFYRADPSRNQAVTGAGLGMSIVKLVAEKHGATVNVSSVEGTGTEIKIEFQKNDKAADI